MAGWLHLLPVTGSPLQVLFAKCPPDLLLSGNGCLEKLLVEKSYNGVAGSEHSLKTETNAQHQS